MSDSLWPCGLQHARLPCPSPTPGACSNLCPSSRWCHPTSHPLSSPSSPAFNLAQHQDLFKWVSSSYQVAKVLEFQLQHRSFQIMFRTDFLKDWLIWSPCSPRYSYEFSTPQFKSINSSVLSFLYSSTLTSIHDYWKNHSFDYISKSRWSLEEPWLGFCWSQYITFVCSGALVYLFARRWKERNFPVRP